MLLKNALVFVSGRFQRLDVTVENGTITALEETHSSHINNNEECLDCTGMLLLPGLLDLHTHGCGGFDFDHANASQLAQMENIYLAHGVTSVLATLMTNPVDVLQSAARQCGSACGHVLQGIYLEGPFFGAEKKGAHRTDCLRPVEESLLDALDSASGGNIRLIAIDPCLPGALELIAKRRDKRFSLAHTPATFEQAQAGFAAGANQVTHLFNAMTGLHHREPGLVGAALAGKCYAEVICDGIHIHPAVLKTAFTALGNRGLIISDSMSACGLCDGEYTLGGQQVFVRGRRATLKDGTIAGSVTFLWDGMVNLHRSGVPLEQAISAATEVPAKAAGLTGKCGSIAPGMPADLCLCTSDLALRQVWKQGKACLPEFSL